MSSERKGKLYLIGAGPGDPELLTLKAARVLGECDVILYDRLVAKEILTHARRDAELIYVGKHRGEQEPTQRSIFELITRHAAAGKIVGRLKGGDPLVFGRGAEEWALAAQHGIAVELVPGITSAIAVPGLAGIPVTFRGVSQSFAVITGHCHEGRTCDWTCYASIDTLVVLMGVTNRAFIAQSLITAGRNASEPVAFIEQGTRPGERITKSCLEEVASGRVAVNSPAVLVIGDVVNVLCRASESQAQSAPAPPAQE